MGAHDVVVECERFSLDVNDRCTHECCYLTTSFRSRSGTMNSNSAAVGMILKTNSCNTCIEFDCFRYLISVAVAQEYAG